MLPRSLLMGAVATAALVIAACSGSSNDASSSSSSGSAATPAAPATTTRSEAATPGGASSPGQAQAASPTAAGSAVAAVPAKLNLNTATREQFLTVPNVGDRFVREFMEYRPYTTILQFRRELGKYVSQDQVAQWEKYVFVPVDPNQSDAETLKQLPGVDNGVASQLIAARPYASTDAFLAKLGQLVSADQAASARAYLAVS